jgi:hypothetical protein
MEGNPSSVASSTLRRSTPDGSRDQYAGQSGHLSDNGPMRKSFPGARNRKPEDLSSLLAEISILKSTACRRTI